MTAARVMQIVVLTIAIFLGSALTGLSAWGTHQAYGVSSLVPDTIRLSFTTFVDENWRFGQVSFYSTYVVSGWGYYTRTYTTTGYVYVGYGKRNGVGSAPPGQEQVNVRAPTPVNAVDPTRPTDPPLRLYSREGHKEFELQRRRDEKARDAAARALAELEDSELRKRQLEKFRQLRRQYTSGPYDSASVHPRRFSSGYSSSTNPYAMGLPDGLSFDNLGAKYSALPILLVFAVLTIIWATLVLIVSAVNPTSKFVSIYCELVCIFVLWVLGFAGVLMASLLFPVYLGGAISIVTVLIAWCLVVLLVMYALFLHFYTSRHYPDKKSKSLVMLLNPSTYVENGTAGARSGTPGPRSAPGPVTAKSNAEFLADYAAAMKDVVNDKGSSTYGRDDTPASLAYGAAAPSADGRAVHPGTGVTTPVAYPAAVHAPPGAVPAPAGMYAPPGMLVPVPSAPGSPPGQQMYYIVPYAQVQMPQGYAGHPGHQSFVSTGSQSTQDPALASHWSSNAPTQPASPTPGSPSLAPSPLPLGAHQRAAQTQIQSGDTQTQQTQHLQTQMPADQQAPQVQTQSPQPEATPGHFQTQIPQPETTGKQMV